MHSHVNSPGLHLMINPVCFIVLHFKHLLNPPNPPVSTRTLFFSLLARKSKTLISVLQMSCKQDLMD